MGVYRGNDNNRVRLRGSRLRGLDQAYNTYANYTGILKYYDDQPLRSGDEGDTMDFTFTFTLKSSCMDQYKFIYHYEWLESGVAEIPTVTSTTPELPTITATSASKQTVVLWSNNNLKAVQNNEQSYYVMLDIETECVVTYIMTYHYFNNGVLPGTIMLYAESGEQWGPFKAEGVEGQGGIKNAYWVADVGEIKLLPGRYSIADSDKSTSSNNALSDYNGIAELRGYTVSGNPFGITEPSTDIGTESNIQSLLENVEDCDAKSQNDLANNYYYGTGVQQDYEKAVEWYRKAADQGDEDAITQLDNLLNNK